MPSATGEDTLDTQSISEIERVRIADLLRPERAARSQGYRSPAGVDEAGRGPLAGPVVAGACIIPQGVVLPGINDSKQLSARMRDSLFDTIQGHPDIVSAVAVVSAEIIDQVNILQATIQAMCEAVRKLRNKPDYLLVDGLALPYPGIPCEKLIKGDSRSQCIAAASVLAKVTRDRLMEDYDIKYPEYGFAQHKGYGTQKHRDALKKWGPCPIHRKTFAPVRTMIQELAGV